MKTNTSPNTPRKIGRKAEEKSPLKTLTSRPPHSRLTSSPKGTCAKWCLHPSPIGLGLGLKKRIPWLLRSYLGPIEFSPSP